MARGKRFPRETIEGKESVMAVKLSPEETNIRKLSRSPIPMNFVKKQNGAWNHQDWLNFLEYLKGKNWVIAYRVVYIVAVFIGSVMNLALVWNLADCMNALMAIPNLISLLFLNGVIVHETRKYLWRDRLDKEM